MLATREVVKDGSLGKWRLVPWHPFPLWGSLPTWSQHLLKPVGSMHQLVRVFTNSQSPALQRGKGTVLGNIFVLVLGCAWNSPRRLFTWDESQSSREMGSQSLVTLGFYLSQGSITVDSGFTPLGFKSKAVLQHLLNWVTTSRLPIFGLQFSHL